ncbi:hypothetical protein AMECASPLE_010187, partial [Ameca splendens]
TNTWSAEVSSELHLSFSFELHLTHEGSKDKPATSGKIRVETFIWNHQSGSSVDRGPDYMSFSVASQSACTL